MIRFFNKLLGRDTKTSEEAELEAGIAASNFVRSIDVASGMIRRHFWIIPIIAFVLLAIVGFFVNSAIRQSLEARIRSELQTLLHVECSILERWFAKQEENASSIANNPEVHGVVHQLVALNQQLADPTFGDKVDQLKTEQSAAEMRLRQLLIPGMATHRFTNFIVLDKDIKVFVSKRRDMNQLEIDPAGVEFYKSVFESGIKISNPFPSRVMQMDSKGVVRGDVPVMSVAVPVQGENNATVACIAFSLKPEREFTRILQLGKLGKTGETYAVNKAGLLLSESRFNEDLKLTGLIPDQEAARSLLNIYIKDPGGALTAGYRPLTRRSELPLTFAAKSVSEGSSGLSLDGHRNYRGEPSVAVWKWLDEFNFGVITEMTTAEAFGPLTILQRVFYFLFALLTITFAALTVFSLVLSRIRQEAHNAAIEAKQLGQYRLDTLLGRGAMGEVYKGQHSMMRRPTAIKLLKSDLVNDTALQRFEHEVQLTCKLNNPNTVAIYDYGRTPDGVFYYAMEYLEGINLQELVEKYGPQPAGRVIHILTQISGSLYEAHTLGLVHRDIKPANIMINRRGGECDVVKVLDFGLVRSLSDDSDPNSDQDMAGTPMYMSPEAIQYPKSVDVRSDIYSLGAVGYFLLTGEPLYQANSLGELFQQHIEHTPDSPSERSGEKFPSELDQAIMGCLQKSRSNRPQTAREFANQLKAIDLDAPWTRTEAESWWMQFDRESHEISHSEFGSSLFGSNAALRSRTRASTKRLNKPKTLRSYDATIVHEPEEPEEE